MGTTIKPIFYSIQETKDFHRTMESDIKAKFSADDADLLLNCPVVYIHVWRSSKDVTDGTWSVYVGETNEIITRTKEHWVAAKANQEDVASRKWQYQMARAKESPTLYVFGHKLFHKSLTLDLENKLIDFCLAMETVRTNNGRGNPQGHYSGEDNLDVIFGMIWRKLKDINSKLFLSEALIKKSAIYKASPNHKLTPSQKKAKQLIIEKTVDAILNRKEGQLIFVEGEAGTGKTVLASSAFYEILENELIKNLGLKSCMLINHDEQRKLYKEMAKRLGYSEEYVKVQVPTTFLKEHSIEKETEYLPDLSKLADLIFVDEAHLLWNQSNQAYNNRFKSPQLDEIIERARVTVIMYDENQVLDKREIPADDYMRKKREESLKQKNYIQLQDQLRMNCSADTMQWVDAFSKCLRVEKLKLNQDNKDSKGYEVKIFDSPLELQEAIKAKASHDETQLSRIIASYDWEYNENARPQNTNYWQVEIGDWSLPWNRELTREKENTRIEKLKYKSLDWAEKDYTIDEVGSTFTIQGFDLAYAGVILGPSIRYNKAKNEISFDETKRAWNQMKGYVNVRNGNRINVTQDISKHELRVLMTRGTQGLYIYACDEALREALKGAIKVS